METKRRLSKENNMLNWLRWPWSRQQPSVQPAQPVQEEAPKAPEILAMSFNDIHTAVVNQQGGSVGVYRPTIPLREDQVERLAELVETRRNFTFDEKTGLLTVRKPQRVAKS